MGRAWREDQVPVSCPLLSLEGCAGGRAEWSWGRTCLAGLEGHGPRLPEPVVLASPWLRPLSVQGRLRHQGLGSQKSLQDAAGLGSGAGTPGCFLLTLRGEGVWTGLPSQDSTCGWRSRSWKQHPSAEGPRPGGHPLTLAPLPAPLAQWQSWPSHAAHVPGMAFLSPSVGRRPGPAGPWVAGELSGSVPGTQQGAAPWGAQRHWPPLCGQEHRDGAEAGMAPSVPRGPAGVPRPGERRHPPPPPGPATPPLHSEASAWLLSKSELVSAPGQEGQERDVSPGGCAFLGVSQEEAGEGKTGLCPGPLLAGAPTRLHHPALWALWVLALALSLRFPWEWGRQQLLPAVGRMEAQTHMYSGPSNTVLTAGLAHARRPPSPEPA